MSGRKFRTTLIKDGDQWLVMELCEPLETLIDLAAEFHGYEGDRFIITVITPSERPPNVMGFRMMDDDEIQPAVQLEFEQERHDEGEIAPLAPEDEVASMDIGGDVQHDAGQAVEGQLVYADRGDHLNVNGIELFPTSALANLRKVFQALVGASEETRAPDSSFCST